MAAAQFIPVLDFILAVPVLIRSIWIGLRQMWNRYFLVYKCSSCGHKVFFGQTKADTLIRMMLRISSTAAETKHFSDIQSRRRITPPPVSVPRQQAFHSRNAYAEEDRENSEKEDFKNRRNSFVPLAAPDSFLAMVEPEFRNLTKMVCQVIRR